MNQDTINNIRSIVDEIIEFSNSREPKIIAKKYNIKVYYRDLGSIKGFSRNDGENKFIAINSELSNLALKVVLAHELGHIFLHKEEFILEIRENFYLSINKYENEANIFAAFLLSEDYILEDLSNLIENEEDEKIIKNLLSILNNN